METRIIGSKISEARRKSNMSQAKLAQLLFISPQAVGKWERGESLPDIIMLYRIAKIFNIDLNYFSDEFGSLEKEIASTMSMDKKQVEIQTGKQEKKLQWDMSHGNWVDADFSGLRNLHEKFSVSNMQRCKFIGSDLSGLLLKSNHVASCDFSDSYFGNSKIEGTYLSKNLFRNCSLKEAEFTDSYISGCDFSESDFTEIVFKNGGFGNNTIKNAILKHSSFIGIYFADIIFEGLLEDCYFENCKFTRVEFQNAKLINTFFKNRSLKRIRFTDCYADRMTYAFLKNGKADLSGITLLSA